MVVYTRTHRRTSTAWWIPGCLFWVSFLMMLAAYGPTMVGAKLLISSEMGPVDLASPDSPIKIKREDGDLHYVNAPLGWAVGTMGNAYFYIDRKDFFGDDPGRGSISMWMKKSTPKLSGPDSPLLGLIGFIPMHEETGYDGLCIQWLTEEERVMGGPSMTFMIMAEDHQNFLCKDEAFNDIVVGAWTLMTFSWDLDGIKGAGGGHQMVVQRNSEIVCYGNVPSTSAMKNSDANVILLGNYRHNVTKIPVLYVDNIRVWDEPMDCSSIRDCYPFNSVVLVPSRSWVPAYLFAAVLVLTLSYWLIQQLRREPALWRPSLWRLPDSYSTLGSTLRDPSELGLLIHDENDGDAESSPRGASASEATDDHVVKLDDGSVEYSFKSVDNQLKAEDDDDHDDTTTTDVWEGIGDDFAEEDAKRREKELIPRLFRSIKAKFTSSVSKQGK